MLIFCEKKLMGFYIFKKTKANSTKKSCQYFPVSTIFLFVYTINKPLHTLILLLNYHQGVYKSPFLIILRYLKYIIKIL